MTSASRLLPTDRFAVLAVIDPDANAAATITTTEIDMALWGSIVAIVMLGTVGSSGTLAFKFEQDDDDGAGSPSGSWVDVTGKAITTMLVSDKQAILQLRGDDLAVSDRSQWVRGSLTTAVATGDSGAIILGFDPKHAPASDRDIASVVEIV